MSQRADRNVFRAHGVLDPGWKLRNVDSGRKTDHLELVAVPTLRRFPYEVNSYFLQLSSLFLGTELLELVARPLRSGLPLCMPMYHHNQQLSIPLNPKAVGKW